MTPTLSRPITALPDILKNNLLSDEINFEEVVIIDLRPCDYIYILHVHITTNKLEIPSSLPSSLHNPYHL